MRKLGKYWIDDEPDAQPLSDEDYEYIDQIEQDKEDLEQEES